MDNNSFFKIPIASPPWTGLGKRLESLCRKALYDFQMIPSTENPKIAIALSGGKDSLALLYMLKAISGRGFPPFELFAIHVHGPFSCGAGVDQNFLRAICKELEIPFIVRDSARKTAEGLECYSCSRERRKLIFDAALEVGATAIAFGHHRDDSIQTLMMNLLHKGEFAANLPTVCMHRYNITIIRPLIYISEADIKTFAKQYEFARITCQCPVGQDSMRKKVDRLIDELEIYFPNARQNLAQAGILYGSHKAEHP